MNRYALPQIRPAATTAVALAAISALSVFSANAAPQPASGPNITVVSPAVSAPAAAASGAVKDVVLDGMAPPTSVQRPQGGRVVSTPSSALASPLPSQARKPSSTLHDAHTASSLAELALNLMQQQSAATGDAQVNSVVSPLSLASALGMVHAGTRGASERELAALMAPQSLGQRMFTTRLPNMLDRLTPPKGKPSPFTMANRVWLDPSVVSAVPPAYAAAVQDRFNADAALVPFGQADTARLAINSWVSDRTAKRIPELMPAGSITPNTRLVVTNAIHFKSPWVQPFDPSQTAPKPFYITPSSSKAVPTMVDERQVLMGTVDNVSVFELPFSGNDFALLIGMPPAGHTLNAFETDLDGTDLVTWSSQLKPTTCRLELPKFNIAPASKSLKPALEEMGVKAVFGPEADFSAMLGKAGKGVYLDNVYQSATITIDEEGGEAAAATGAAVQSKSFSMPAPACPVNRPFIFAVVHKPTGAPLFVGKVADPSKP